MRSPQRPGSRIVLTMLTVWRWSQSSGCSLIGRYSLPPLKNCSAVFGSEATPEAIE